MNTDILDQGVVGDKAVSRPGGSGSTTGDCVVIRTPADSAFVDVEDGMYSETLAIEQGENQILVAAAAHNELNNASTTVRQLRL